MLMDIMMPKMDGIQAMIKIRERSNVPVILLTAKGEDSDKVLGLTVGADDYITKLYPSKYPPESNPNCVAICSWVEVLSGQM